MDTPARMPTVDEIKLAIRETEYKYFGDYTLSPCEHEAIDVLVAVAQAYLRTQAPARTDAEHFRDIIKLAAHIR